MKRRLDLPLAWFTGARRILFLDEPTTFHRSALLAEVQRLAADDV